ncbi:MAG: hypothetical protein ACO1TE_17040 [Prosthecobacter sp.]
MKLSQTKEATQAFVALLEAHLASIHPDYRRNREVKGMRHEYVRELGEGQLAIHSVFCKRGTFYHCFCLSLHRIPIAPFLYSPFTVGGRCDHNYGVTTACHRDLGLSPVDPVAPFRMSDSHMFRKGADRILRRCTSEAEARLLPFYEAVWRRTRPALQALVEFATTTPPDQLAKAAAAYAGPRQGLASHMLEFGRLHDSLPPAQRPAFFAAVATATPEIIRDFAMLFPRITRP